MSFPPPIGHTDQPPPIPPSKGEKESLWEQELTFFFFSEVVANYKRMKETQAAGEDTPTVQGKIQQVEDQLEAGDIPITTALSEIFLIIQDADAPELKGALITEPHQLKDVGSHIKLFLTFLKAHTEQQPYAKRAQDAIKNVQNIKEKGMPPEEVANQINALIHSFNSILPEDLVYPEIPAIYFG